MSKSTVEKNTTRVDAAISAVKETQKKLTTERHKYLKSTNKSERKLAAILIYLACGERGNEGIIHRPKNESEFLAKK